MNELGSFLITFRESLEAALVVGIILAYLIRSRQEKYNGFVYLGVAAGILASIVAAILFSSIAGGFEGAAEEIFEGTTMLIAAFLITFMIFWLINQKQIAKALEGKVQENIGKAYVFGIFLIVFLSVLREGIETVLFLGAASFLGGGQYSIVGALAGIAAAIILGYLLFAQMLKVDLKKVFLFTSIFLALFAAGLIANGIHELQEANLIPVLKEEAWDINPPIGADGGYPLLHEKGAIGSIARGLFGYNGNPSVLEVIGYFTYLIFIFWFLFRGRLKKAAA